VKTFDAAFAGSSVKVLDHTGTEAALHIERWAGRASVDDEALFVDQCAGPTIDLGCGPGRLVRALLERGVSTVGVDSSAEAVRLARTHGLPVLRRNIFDPVPREGEWSHAILADGNVGIGGRPVRLLRRAWAMLAAGGRLHIELGEPGFGVAHGWRQLRVDGHLGPRFPWAAVSIDAIGELGARAGFDHTDSLTQGGRHVAVLTKAVS
jgi:SAM-dependent methyltransferase